MKPSLIYLKLDVNFCMICGGTEMSHGVVEIKKRSAVNWGAPSAQGYINKTTLYIKVNLKVNTCIFETQICAYVCFRRRRIRFLIT